MFFYSKKSENQTHHPLQFPMMLLIKRSILDANISRYMLEKKIGGDPINLLNFHQKSSS